MSRDSAEIRPDGYGARPLMCWGEVLWDLFPDQRRLGGAPANVAFHLAILGSPVALVSRVGDDPPGRDAVAALAARGVDTSLIQVDLEAPTGRVDIELFDGEPRYTLNPGCAWERIQATREVVDALSRASALCYNTLSQRLDRSQLDRALAAVSDDCITACDPNLRPDHIDVDLLRAAVTSAKVIKLNEREVGVIERRLGAADPVRWLVDDVGAELVAITRGERGSALHTRAGSVEHPGYPAAPGGDNVGAGDAFMAALLHGLRESRAIVGVGDLDALAAINQRANRYASFVASHRGATPVASSDVLAELTARS